MAGSCARVGGKAIVARIVRSAPEISGKWMAVGGDRADANVNDVVFKFYEG